MLDRTSTKELGIMMLPRRLWRTWCFWGITVAKKPAQAFLTSIYTYALDILWKLTLSSHFGSSLAYANCEGTGGAASPQILADAVLPSDKEIIVMLGEKCVDGGACGYSRPGTVAHRKCSVFSVLHKVEAHQLQRALAVRTNSS
jgi:hypothetical protein